MASRLRSGLRHGVADARGAGSVLVVAIISAVLLLMLASAPLYRGLMLKGLAATAADAAALAAADVAIGIVPGIACDSAASVASANGAVLQECSLDGLVATVSVTVSAGGLGAAATATAGPPSAR
ncbi:secretion/DNA translocation related TadE-like protein [Homoserinimonas aerilata]|uniref:Secretion/DNA translocation related TadE-like protein n=2 Tax=Homoserinimonas aerilata TaxID=1162970 RepID=A0A542YKW7_9MICO|nr:secretion/DNA translocation related TadE-like protein [Homoserinimonas aerilata]